MSETLAMPAALAVGGHGRKGSLPLEARKADCMGLHLRPFLCEIIWVDLIYTFFRGGGQRSCVYYFTNYFRPSPRFLREIELQ